MELTKLLNLHNLFLSKEMPENEIALSKINYDTFNYRIRDTDYNTMITKYYCEYFQYFQEMKKKIRVPKNFYDKMKEFNLFGNSSPQSIHEDNDKFKFYFELKSTNLEKKEIAIKELKKLNQEK